MISLRAQWKGLEKLNVLLAFSKHRDAPVFEQFQRMYFVIQFFLLEVHVNPLGLKRSFRFEPNSFVWPCVCGCRNLNAYGRTSSVCAPSGYKDNAETRDALRKAIKPVER